MNGLSSKELQYIQQNKRFRKTERKCLYPDPGSTHIIPKLKGILVKNNSVPSAGNGSCNISRGIINKKAFIRIQEEFFGKYLVDFPHGFDDLYIA